MEQIEIKINLDEKELKSKEELFQRSQLRCREQKRQLEDAKNKREQIKDLLLAVTKTYDKKKDKVEEDRKDIEQKTRERDLLNKDVASAEEKEKDQIGTIQTLENELKKLQNKIQGYKAEA